MKSSTKLIIFDFDGVLADSFNTFYPLLRDSAAYIDIGLSRKQYRNLFIKNVHQSLKDLTGNQEQYLKMMNFRKDNFDKYYYDPRNQAKFFPGVAEFLKKINKKYILTIASSGKKENIENLLNKNGLDDLFDLILANSEASKIGMIKDILSKFKVRAKETTMITDTVGDLRVAQKTGLKTIAVTWGFHSGKLLKSEKPNYLAKSFKMLYKYLKAF